MKWNFKFKTMSKAFKQPLHPLKVVECNSISGILSTSEPWPQVAGIQPDNIEIKLLSGSNYSELKFTCDPSHKCPNKLEVFVCLTSDELTELGDFFENGIAGQKVFELNGEADFADQWTNSIPGIPNQTDFEGGQPAKFHNLNWT